MGDNDLGELEEEEHTFESGRHDTQSMKSDHSLMIRAADFDILNIKMKESFSGLLGKDNALNSSRE
jgi:predicted DNA binding CopG/RHH family protein